MAQKVSSRPAALSQNFWPPHPFTGWKIFGANCVIVKLGALPYSRKKLDQNWQICVGRGLRLDLPPWPDLPEFTLPAYNFRFPFPFLSLDINWGLNKFSWFVKWCSAVFKTKTRGFWEKISMSKELHMRTLNNRQTESQVKQRWLFTVFFDIYILHKNMCHLLWKKLTSGNFTFF